MSLQKNCRGRGTKSVYVSHPLRTVRTYLAFAGRVDQVVFEEVEVRLQLWVDEAGVDLTGDAVGDGLEEEGDGCVFDV